MGKSLQKCIRLDRGIFETSYGGKTRGTVCIRLYRHLFAFTQCMTGNGGKEQSHIWFAEAKSELGSMREKYSDTIPELSRAESMLLFLED